MRKYTWAIIAGVCVLVLIVVGAYLPAVAVEAYYPSV